MTDVRATLEATTQDYISLELEIDEQVVIGHAAASAGAEPPDYDLAEILAAEELGNVAAAHAKIVYQEGDFWLEALGDHPTWIKKYEVVPGRPVRLVDGDLVRFGDAELTFHIHKLGPDPSSVTRASVSD